VSAYLLDTNAALIALTDPAMLSPAARAAVQGGPNLLSVVSYWEVLLKSMKRKLQVGNPRTWWMDALDQLAATPLLLRPEHLAVVYSLPPLHTDHTDPFDRVLIAQAIAEELELVTTDREIPQYASVQFRVIS
jgi:PIN domain nuclease of toxin-antitoxin system